MPGTTLGPPAKHFSASVLKGNIETISGIYQDGSCATGP